MTVSGIRLVFYQYLSNMFYVLALFLGFEIFHLIGDANAVRADWEYLTGYYAQFINIFFMSGIIYLMLSYSQPHIFFALTIRGIAGFSGLGTLGCLITFVVIFILTEGTVRLYNSLYGRIKGNK